LADYLNIAIGEEVFIRLYFQVSYFAFSSQLKLTGRMAQLATERISLGHVTFGV